MAEQTDSAEGAVRAIRQVVRKKPSSEEKVGIVLRGVRCETGIGSRLSSRVPR